MVMLRKDLYQKLKQETSLNLRMKAARKIMLLERLKIANHGKEDVPEVQRKNVSYDVENQKCFQKGTRKNLALNRVWNWNLSQNPVLSQMKSQTLRKSNLSPILGQALVQGIVQSKNQTLIHLHHHPPLHPLLPHPVLRHQGQIRAL